MNPNRMDGMYTEGRKWEKSENWAHWDWKVKTKPRRKRDEEQEEQIIELESPSIVGNQFWAFEKKRTDGKQHIERASECVWEREQEKYQLNWKWIVNRCTGNTSTSLGYMCMLCALRIYKLLYMYLDECWALSFYVYIILCVPIYVCLRPCVCVCECVVVLSTVNLCTVLCHGWRGCSSIWKIHSWAQKCLAITTATTAATDTQSKV